MTKETKTYVVLYPFGTGSRSYKLFSTRDEACAFLDSESNHTRIILPDGTVTIGVVDGDIEHVEELIWSMTHEDDDGDIQSHDAEEALEELMGENQEDVKHWRVEEAEDGTWTDDSDTYATREEAEEANTPSQYLIIV